MKTCPKCGEAKALAEFSRHAKRYDGLAYHCRVCAKASSAKWRAENREKGRARSAKYYAENRDQVRGKVAKYQAENAEKVKASGAKYRAANPEKVKSRIDKYRAENSEKVKATYAVYREVNPDKVKAASAKWKAANPEAILIHNQNRRAMKLSNGGTLSKGLSEKLFKLQRGKCPCCGEPLGDDYHLDHIMPLVLGGVNEDWNIQLLRATCNHQKHAKHPVDFMQSRGFLL